METNKDIREYNVGNSDYSKHKIQPWDIWREYNLNPWDADIVKRVLRAKEEPGKSREESRILDYEKIIHVCQERIRQLEEEKLSTISISRGEGWEISNCANISLDKFFGHHLNEEEVKAYEKFSKEHSKLHGGTCGCSMIFHATGIGLVKNITCEECGESKDITDYSNW